MSTSLNAPEMVLKNRLSGNVGIDPKEAQMLVHHMKRVAGTRGLSTLQLIEQMHELKLN